MSNNTIEITSNRSWFRNRRTGDKIYPRVGEVVILDFPACVYGGWGQDWRCDGADLEVGDSVTLAVAGNAARPALWRVTRSSLEAQS